jgi:hypothetical protein
MPALGQAIDAEGESMMKNAKAIVLPAGGFLDMLAPLTG